MGFASGFQVGQQAVERGIKLREEDQERKRIREAMGLAPQQIAPRPPTEDELGRAQAYTQAIADQDARMFATENSLENRTGLFSSNPAERPLDASVAPQMPYAGQSVGGLQYRLGDQTLNRMPTQQEIESARYSAAANVLAERDPVAAMRMRQEQVRMQREAELAPLQKQQLEGQIAGQEQQRALTGIQLSDAERKQKQQAAFDTGFAEINQQKFDKPEERTAAILSLVEKTQGVTAAEQLRASYSQNELNQISLQAKKFDEGFRQSRAKGVIPALEWFDEQNTSFKLERDPKNPFRVIQVNTDGSRTLFADAKNERELGMIVDAKAKPGGFLELAKFDLDQKKAEAAIRASNATTVSAQQSPVEKNLAALQRLGVKVSPEEIKSMAGVKAPALSPEAAAQLEIITASLKDNSTPANIEAARAAVTDIFRSEGLKQRNTTIVNGLRTAAGKNDLPTAVKQLQDAGVANETIVGLARQAGVSIPAELLPPAPVPQTGLNTNAPRQPIQLLAPLNAIGDYRRRMIEEQQAAGGSGGLVNPAGF